MMKIIAACLLFLSGLPFATAANAQFGQPAYKLIADDGRPVANHRVAPDLAAAIERLPGIVVAGNPNGDVTLAEFYDLNCPLCRIASADIGQLLRTDKQLRVILVPFPVLGVSSIQAGRVEIGVRQLGTPAQFYEFHRRIFAGRGVVDGGRALAVAREMKFDEHKLAAAANEDAVIETLKSHVKLGDALNLMVTPSLVIKDVAILGHPGPRGLKGIIESVRRCGALVC